MLDHVGERLVLVVAQKPFETPSATGIYHQFATLIPLINADGTRAERSEFPANGDVWWMLRPGIRGLAEPGRLLEGVLEESQQVGEAAKAHYQIVVDSVEQLRSRNYIEILDVPPERIGQPRDLVSKRGVLTSDHIPADEIYANWRGSLFGPFRVKTEVADAAEGQWLVTLVPVQSDSSVLQIPDEMLSDIPAWKNHRIDVEVSLRDQPVHESSRLHTCRYHLVEADAFREYVPPDAPRIVLQTDDAIIQRLAKRFLTRGKKQEFKRLLTEFQDTISTSGEPVAEQDASLLSQLQGAVDQELAVLDKLGEAILETGLLEERIGKSIERASERYISENAARLQTEINRQIAELRAEHERLEAAREALDSEIETVRRERVQAVDEEIRQKRMAGERQLEEREEQLQRQVQELDRQRQLLSENLAKVAEELGTNRDGLVNQFLAISPLLQQFGLLPNGVSTKGRAETLDTEIGERNQAVFALPEFVTKSRPADPPAIEEEAFFERFRQHTEKSGFRYREIDLLSFHTSVKCGFMTILGGLPGTGKSSLPRLYAEALLGDDIEDGDARFLHIPVSPSWLDMRDLLGHVNALDKCFQPSESHLFQVLVFSCEEYTRHRAATGLYLVCLDEMNLSHVEHYFSGFLQRLEGTEGYRELRCFPENVVSASSPFARWASVQIPPSLRFVGTVNFDETTKQLSQRLLDRANLITLPSELLALELREPTSVKPSGAPISLRTYRSWVSQTAHFGPELGEVVDSLREHLIALGCPMNPRRFSAIRKFIASVPPGLGTPETGLDLQIAQRVLPQISGLFRPGAREAVQSVRRILENHAFRFSESLRVLDSISRSVYPDLFHEEGFEE